LSKSATPAWQLHGRARQALQWLHRWLGFSVGVAYALIALSGSVLAFQQPLLRLAYPHLATHPLPNSTQQAMVLTRLADDWRARGLRAADLPIPALPVWQLYFADGTRRYLNPADGNVLLSRTPHGDVMQLLRNWHTHLLAGERGRNLLGTIGWLTLFLLASGPLLWWPGRRQLAASLRPHMQPPIRRWLSWHRSVGVLALPLLLLVSLSGTLMVFHVGTARVLRGLFAEPSPAQPVTSITPRDAPIDWRAVLDAAQRALPGAALHRIALPTASNALVSIRLQAGSEWHPVGRSAVWLDPYTATELGSNDATRNGPGARLNDAIYPLHSGHVGGWPWRVAVACSGLLPPFFLVTGFLFWRTRTRARK
jgi:uncharacterized iron-regulated membrane protein